MLFVVDFDGTLSVRDTVDAMLEQFADPSWEDVEKEWLDGHITAVQCMQKQLRMVSVNMSLRKVTKSRGSFPNDEAVMKLFHLALQNISQKWTMPLRDWKPALNRFTIQFEERMPQQ